MLCTSEAAAQLHSASRELSSKLAIGSPLRAEMTGDSFPRNKTVC